MKIDYVFLMQRETDEKVIVVVTLIFLVRYPSFYAFVLHIRGSRSCFLGCILSLAIHGHTYIATKRFCVIHKIPYWE